MSSCKPENFLKLTFIKHYVSGKIKKREEIRKNRKTEKDRKTYRQTKKERKKERQTQMIMSIDIEKLL